MISSNDDGNIVDNAIACLRRNIIQDSGHVSFNNKNISKKHRKNEKKNNLPHFEANITDSPKQLAKSSILFKMA